STILYNIPYGGIGHVAAGGERARVGRVTPASVRSSQWLTRRCCEPDSDRQNRQNLNDFLQRQATDMESHDAPTTIPGDDRLYPNPAELLAAFERFPPPP